MQGNGTGKCLYLVRKLWKCPPNWVSAFWHFKGRDSFLRSSTFRWITACCRNNERLLLCPAAQPSPANHCALHKPSLDTLKPAEGTFAPSCLIIYCIIIIILPLLWLQTFIQIVLLSFSTVDASMMSGLSGKHMPPSLPPSLHPPMLYLADLCMLPANDSFIVEPTPMWPRRPCNESRLRWEVEVCGEVFKKDMDHIDPQYWCNLTYFIGYVHTFLWCCGCRSVSQGELEHS